MAQTILQVENIKKSFAIVQALKGVSMQVHAGEIRGLIGENGSGKSTLSSIIAGVQRCDEGSMVFESEVYDPHNVLQAQTRGVGMVVQEMGTISNISVAENIFLGKEKLFAKAGIVSTRQMQHAANKLLQEVGLGHIDARLPIDAYNAEDRKLVEIARAMQQQPKLLIVDETTTALSQKGRNLLYGLMRTLTQNGKAVLFISHDLEEIMEQCDSLTVLRDGEFIADLEKSDFEPEKIKHLMVGRKLEGDYYRSDYDGSHGAAPVLVMNNVCDNVLQNVSFTLHEGEILGIGGLSESGMRNIGRLAFGIGRPSAGSVKLAKTGAEVTSPQQCIHSKVGYASKNRDVESLVLDDSISNNLVVPVYDQLRHKGFIMPAAEKQYAADQIEYFSIKCSGVDQLVGTLSGGNKQKVVFGRWLGAQSEILILDCPTRGVDIGVKTVMYQLIYRLKKEGKSILMISEEIAELIGMCDRLLVVKDGRINGELPRSESLCEHDVIEYMI